jgi:hypothetical protein
MINSFPNISDAEETTNVTTTMDLERDFLLFQSLVGNKTSPSS